MRDELAPPLLEFGLDALDAHLGALVRGMEKVPATEARTEMIPDGVLAIRADARLPADVVLEVLQACQDAGIWKLDSPTGTRPVAFPCICLPEEESTSAWTCFRSTCSTRMRPATYIASLTVHGCRLSPCAPS